MSHEVKLPAQRDPAYPMGKDVSNNCDGCSYSKGCCYGSGSGQCVPRHSNDDGPLTTNYLLIEVIERDISVPEQYTTFEQAQEAMFQKIAEAVGEKVETIREAYLAGEDIKHGAVVLENIAYCERHGQNYDWMIFAFDGGEWREASTSASEECGV